LALTDRFASNGSSGYRPGGGPRAFSPRRYLRYLGLMNTKRFRNKMLKAATKDIEGRQRQLERRSKDRPGHEQSLGDSRSGRRVADRRDGIQMRHDAAPLGREPVGQGGCPQNTRADRLRPVLTADSSLDVVADATLQASDKSVQPLASMANG